MMNHRESFGSGSPFKGENPMSHKDMSEELPEFLRMISPDLDPDSDSAPLNLDVLSPKKKKSSPPEDNEFLEAA
jgi:hypothetical protein